MNRKRLLRKLRLISLLPIAGAIVLALVAFDPIRRIRLGLIRSSRIGHFITNVEAYLCRIEAGLGAKPPGSIDVFFFEDQICNREIADEWRRLLHVFPFSNLAYVAARLLSKSRWLSRRHLIAPEEMSFIGRSAERALHRFRGHIRLDDDVRIAGKQFADTIARGKPIVCFHVRDSAYLRQTQPGFDYSYHDYRDWRNEDLKLAIEELTRRGFFLVRMGAIVDAPLPFASHSVFDYPLSNCRSDRMDLALGSQCSFWLGSASGALDIPFEFRRPMVIVNHVCPLIPQEPRLTIYDNSIWIFKSFWHEAQGRRLTFREILDTGAGGFSYSREFAAAGIRLADNSPEDIRDTAVEMAERVKGTWVTSPEDEARQRRFWALWGEQAHAHAVEANVRIGARYLARNAELLT